MKYLVLIALFTTVQTVSAQVGATIDTLDWRTYYPLQVGNVWEYTHSVGDPVDYSLVTVEIDTVVNGQHYFRLRNERYSGQFGGLFSSFEHYVRYDSTGQVIGFHDVSNDTSSAEHAEVNFTFGVDLRTAFGDTVSGAGDRVVYWTEGGYSSIIEITGQSYEVAALKRFTDGTRLESYASGIGRLRSGNLWSTHLTYAQIGNEEYGHRHLDTHDESIPNDQITHTRVEVYPIPASAEVTINLFVARNDRIAVDLHNPVGQRVWYHRAETLLSGAHRWEFDASSLPAGVYLLRIITSRGVVAATPLLIAR